MKKVLIAAAFAAISCSTFAATPDLPSCDQWAVAASCNYSNANRPSSHPINYVVIHKVQGSASGSVAWYQNCASGVSAHFTYNNTTGYCYQSVYEADIAWHAGWSSTNQQSVGIEHGGYINTNDTATVCYDKSALETKSTIVYSSVLWNRSRIIGHYQVPGCGSSGGGGTSCHTDPGQYWNWTYYMSKCNPNPTNPGAQTYIDDSPAVSASWATASSSADKYGADYKWRSTAAISDAASWTINVASAGNYDISAWWPQGGNRSQTAGYHLPNAAVVNKNQQTNGGTWNLLGTIGLGAGNQTTLLSCWTTTGFIVVADAVRYYGPK
jgi:N-acetyl-anhydromuramyl-L-alanine amidase AmpD